MPILTTAAFSSRPVGRLTNAATFPTAGAATARPRQAVRIIALTATFVTPEEGATAEKNRGRNGGNESA